MEAVTTFDDFTVQTIYGSSNTFNFQFGIVSKCGVSVGGLSVGSESSIVIEHNICGTGVSAAFNIGVVVKCNLGAHGGEGCLSRSVEFRGEETSRSLVE